MNRLIEFPSQIFLASLLITLGLLSRFIPHPPNMTALLSIAWLAGIIFSLKKSVGITLVIMIVSDLILAYESSANMIGTWPIFTCSGFLGIAGIAFLCRENLSWSWGVFLFFASSLGFWIWTNAGVWLLDGLYPHTTSGLITCYTVALPFLRNQLLGDFMWMGILLGTMNGLSLCINWRDRKIDKFV